MWTNSCCSHPLATPSEMEETAARGVRLAAQRRAIIELGLRPDHCRPEQIRYITRILYAATSANQEWGEHELDYILFYRGEVSVEPNPDEVSAVEWVGREQLPEFVADVRAAGGQLTPWFRLISQVPIT
jgi:isopentenyl-diphosphate Delta-isomerase